MKMGFTIMGSHKKRGFIFLEKGVHKKEGSSEPPEPAPPPATGLLL